MFMSRHDKLVTELTHSQGIRFCLSVCFACYNHWTPTTSLDPKIVSKLLCLLFAPKMTLNPISLCILRKNLFLHLNTSNVHPFVPQNLQQNKPIIIVSLNADHFIYEEL